MKIKDIELLAELAKIELKTEEAKTLLKDIESILSYVKQIEEINLSKEDEIESHIIPAYLNKNVWREDELEVKDERMFSHDLIIKQFPNSKDNFVKVKKIL